MTQLPEPTRSDYAQLAPMVDACEPREMESHVWRVVRDQRDKICDLEWKLENTKRRLSAWAILAWVLIGAFAVVSMVKI